MLNDNYGGRIGSGMDKSPEACKPDPEERLQRSRNRLGECIKAEELLLALKNSPVNINFGNNNHDAILCAFGSIALEKNEANETIDYWLKEIDKG